MANQFEHFSHEHPLTTLYADFEEVDDESKDPESYLCSICGLPILSSPSFKCSNSGCSFFLHKPCAELPKSLQHPRYHPMPSTSILDFHTLELIRMPESSPRIFTYQCEICGIDQHPLVAGEVKLKIKHKSHQAHFLVANCRETLSMCDACGEEERGFFFACHECNFWIHQDCTLLPSDIKIASHPHPLILLYSISHHLLGTPVCIICQRGRLMQIGFYYCGDCTTYAHLSCAKKDFDNNFKSEISAKLIQLPSGDDEGSLVIRRVLERYTGPIAVDKVMKIDERLHKHPSLILIDGIREIAFGTSNLACDVCVRPINISSPFYTCQQHLFCQSNDDEYCDFFVHDMCAIFLSRIDLEGRKPKHITFDGVLYPEASKSVFDSIFPCVICRRPCNGFCYLHSENHFMACLECLVIPVTITHASHRQHVLVLTTRGKEQHVPLNCCSKKSAGLDVFKCLHCTDFYIHVGCALLPKTTQHKFDEHPLELITHRHDCSSSESCFCEFCEGEIDQQYWYYGCGECRNYFHINCIPSVGYLSKIIFGKTHSDHEIHSHPLTLTRMLTVGRHERCGCCRKIIPGFADETAFHCCQCDFWIHFDCARDSSCQPLLPVYSEVEEDAERLIESIFLLT